MAHKFVLKCARTFSNSWIQLDFVFMDSSVDCMNTREVALKKLQEVAFSSASYTVSYAGFVYSCSWNDAWHTICGIYFQGLYSRAIKFFISLVALLTLLSDVRWFSHKVQQVEQEVKQHRVTPPEERSICGAALLLVALVHLYFLLRWCCFTSPFRGTHR